MICQKGIKSKR